MVTGHTDTARKFIEAHDFLSAIEHLGAAIEVGEPTAASTFLSVANLNTFAKRCTTVSAIKAYCKGARCKHPWCWHHLPGDYNNTIITKGITMNLSIVCMLVVGVSLGCEAERDEGTVLWDCRHVPISRQRSQVSSEQYSIMLHM